MRIDRNGQPPIVVGKRVTIGAAIMAISEAVQFYLPDHAPAIGQLTIPVIFIVQLILANRYGVTTHVD